MDRLPFFRVGVVVVVLLCLAPIGAAQTLTLNQVDDFEAGTLRNWTQGIPTGNLVVVAGGPTGSTMNMQISSSGGIGAGSRLAAFNQVQWVGNYTAAGINTIEMDIRSPTSSATATLQMRIGFRNVSGAGYLSNAIAIPNDGVWRHVSYPLTAGNFTAVNSPASPFDTFIATPGDQDQFRILSATGIGSLNGDTINAVVGIDNVRASFVPIPEPSWVLAVVVTAVVAGRRRWRHIQ